MQHNGKMNCTSPSDPRPSLMGLVLLSPEYAHEWQIAKENILMTENVYRIISW